MHSILYLILAAAATTHLISLANSNGLQCNALQPSRVTLRMVDTSNESLRNEILNGVALKLKTIKERDGAEQQPVTVLSDMQAADTTTNCTYSYYVREACKSEINEITTVLMKSFHPQSQPLFDSYIQRYKYNHLQMCFHLSKSDIGIFVACASSDDAAGENQTNEEIVGFCCVDGRPNDPSSRVEFLTESTLASTCPRPYLSDLGVLPAHRRKGIGQTLVGACEDWATKRGYDTIYLKVDETNKGTMKLYKGMGYNKTVLPGVIPGSGSKKWGNDVLLEKRICVKEDAEIEKRTNWFRRILKKVVQSS